MSGAGAVDGCVVVAVASFHCHYCDRSCVEALQKVVVVMQISLWCDLEYLVSLHAGLLLHHVDAAVDVESEVADSIDARFK